jgi:hypothetical protein
VRFKNGAISIIDVPGALFTEADGINDNGDIVGIFADTDDHVQGFLCPKCTKGTPTFVPINVPKSTFTKAFGINNRGEIVGVFSKTDTPSGDDDDDDLGFYRSAS